MKQITYEANAVIAEAMQKQEMMDSAGRTGLWVIAQIDGVAELRLSRNTAHWINHDESDVPGHYGGALYPSRIGKAGPAAPPWNAQFPVRRGPATSDIWPHVEPALPEVIRNPQVVTYGGRGQVALLRHREDMIGILISDLDPGPGYYTLYVDWEI